MKITINLEDKQSTTTINNGFGFNFHGSVKAPEISTLKWLESAFQDLFTTCLPKENAALSEMSSKLEEMPSKAKWEFWQKRKYKFYQFD